MNIDENPLIYSTQDGCPGLETSAVLLLSYFAHPRDHSQTARKRSIESKPKTCALKKKKSSSGDGGDDSSDDDDGDNSDDSDESDSDDGTPLTSSRGRATVPDRRNGSGGAAKPKQKEAEPVSPPRQSVIAAAHNAEVGSQIKVKFDTGHWYSGTILKVDPQRCVGASSLGYMGGSF